MSNQTKINQITEITEDKPGRLRETYFLNNYPEVLKEIKGSPDFIWDKEKELHKLCKEFRYTPEIYFDGQTECFNKECLPLLNLT